MLLPRATHQVNVRACIRMGLLSPSTVLTADPALMHSVSPLHLFSFNPHNNSLKELLLLSPSLALFSKCHTAPKINLCYFNRWRRTSHGRWGGEKNKTKQNWGISENWGISGCGQPMYHFGV